MIIFVKISVNWIKLYLNVIFCLGMGKTVRTREIARFAKRTLISNAVERHRVSTKIVKFRLKQMCKLKCWLALTLSIFWLENILLYKNCLKKKTLCVFVEKNGVSVKKINCFARVRDKRVTNLKFSRNVYFYTTFDLPKTLFQSKVIQLKFLVLPLSVNTCT